MRELLESYPHYHYFVASAQLVLAMFGMGAVMRFRDFVEIVRDPKPFFAGFLFQLIGIPLIAAALVHLVDLPSPIAVGFIMLAAMPSGSMANVYTFIGRGNAALSVSLTGILTLVALVTAPLILRLLAADYLPPEIPMPTGMIVREICVFLLLPLGIGMAVGRSIPKHAPRISKVAVRGSLVGLAIVIIGSLGSGHLEIFSYGYKIPLLIFAFCAVIQGLGFRLSLHLFKFSWRDATAISIVSGMRNINLALMITASVFRMEGPAADFGLGVLFVLLLYGGSSLFIAASPAIQNFRHQKKRLAAETVD